MKRVFFSTMSLPIIVAMVFAFTLATFGSAGTAEAALSTAGKITSVEGKVAVFRKGKTRGILAKVGTQVFPGDRIKTSKNSKAQLMLRDNSKIIISAKSNMKVGKFTLDRKKEKRSAFLSILSGKIRIVAQKMYKLTASGKRKLWRNASFKIKTPTAVVGVKGTDFVITVKLKDGTTYTGIIVIEGAVTAQSISKLGKLSPSVLLSKMEQVEVSQDGISKKTPVSETEVNQLVEALQMEEQSIEHEVEDIEQLKEDIEDNDVLTDEQKDEMLDELDADIEAVEDTTTVESVIIIESTTDTSTGGGTTTCVSPPCL